MTVGRDAATYGRRLGGNLPKRCPTTVAYVRKPKKALRLLSGIGRIVLCLALSASYGRAQAIGDIRGRVVDMHDKTPVAGAHVAVRDENRVAQTDSNGRFLLTALRAGRVHVVIEAVGFVVDTAVVELMEDEVLVRDFVLQRADSTPRRARPAEGTRAVVRLQVNDAGGRPIPYANVDVGGARRIADEGGRLGVELRVPQRVALEVRRIGYRAQRFEIHFAGDTNLTISLDPVVQTLPGATITASEPRRSLLLSGFYRRSQDREKGVNRGYFITEEDIDRRNPTRIMNMLDGIPSIRVMRTCTNDADPRCNVPVGVNGCPVTVYLDGRRLNSLRTNSYVEGLNDLVPPSHVAGIEVYTSPVGTPPEYQPLGGLCGTIVIWTK